MTVKLTGDTLTLDDLLAVARDGAHVELARGRPGARRAGSAVVERCARRGLAGLRPHDRGRRAQANTRRAGRSRRVQPAAGARASCRAGRPGPRRRRSRAAPAGRERVRARHVRRAARAARAARRAAERRAAAGGAHARLDRDGRPARERRPRLRRARRVRARREGRARAAQQQRLLDRTRRARARRRRRGCSTRSMLPPPSTSRRSPAISARSSRAAVPALLDGSYLWRGRRAKPAGSAQLPLHPAGARRRARHVRVRTRAARTRAERSQENPFVLLDEERIISVGELRRDRARSGARLHAHRARAGADDRIRAHREAAAGARHRPARGSRGGVSGLAESGLSEFGVPVQALAAEAKLLAQPVSIETASTSHHEGIEDRITLAPLCARRLAAMVELGERHRRDRARRRSAGDRPARAAAARRRDRALYGKVRELVPTTGHGEPPPQDLEPVRELVRSGAWHR